MAECSEVKCAEPARKGGLCARHARNAYMREYARGGPDRCCEVPGCGRGMYGRSGLCAMHYKRRATTGETGEANARFLHASVEERIRRLFTDVGPEICWHWQGPVRRNGYGYLRAGIAAHRLVYELLVGPIPDGLTLDHVCHNRNGTCRGGDGCRHRRCVNPAHLEPVTREENAGRVRNRKDRCPAGHDLTDEANVRWTDGGTKRRCRACLSEQRRARYDRLGR